MGKQIGYWVGLWLYLIRLKSALPFKVQLFWWLMLISTSEGFSPTGQYIYTGTSPVDLPKWIPGWPVVSQHHLPAPLPLWYSHLLLHFLAWHQGEISLCLSVILKLYSLCFRSKTLMKTEVRMQYFYVSGSLPIIKWGVLSTHVISSLTQVYYFFF